MAVMRDIARYRGILSVDERGLVNGDEVYQFGVGGGWSMQLLRRVFTQSRFIGFDSFEGLPEEASHVFTHDTWTPGVMKHDLSADDLRTVMGGPRPTALVRGFFNTSLTSALLHTLKLLPATYIDVDVDLYISSFQVLDYMFKFGLVEVGTLVGYDDWWCIPCSENSTNVFEAGEGRAHWEITQKYRVRFKCVAGPCVYKRGGLLNRCSIHSGWSPVFIVTEIGARAPHTGFSMNSDEVRLWQRSPFCSSWIYERKKATKIKSTHEPQAEAMNLLDDVTLP